MNLRVLNLVNNLIFICTGSASGRCQSGSASLSLRVRLTDCYFTDTALALLRLSLFTLSCPSTGRYSWARTTTLHLHLQVTDINNFVRGSVFFRQNLTIHNGDNKSSDTPKRRQQWSQRPQLESKRRQPLVKTATTIGQNGDNHWLKQRQPMVKTATVV